MGSFTITSAYWAFQGATVSGDFASTMNFATDLFNPATAPASLTWTNGTGPSAFSAFLFLPAVDSSGNPFMQDVVLDSTDLQPGGVNLTLTNTGAEVKFRGGIEYTDLSTNAIATITIAGVVTPGTEGALDSASDSFALTEGTRIVTGKSGGTGMATPEPSFRALTALGFALLLAGVIVSRRRLQRTVLP